VAQTPLDGLRVLELQAGPAAAYCGRLLARAGADVLTIEPPGGSPLRQLPPFAGDEPGPERGLAYLYTSAGKRATTLDLATAAGRAALLELLRDADALIDDLPPARLAAFGLDETALCAVNPRLVWTSITPFGQSGPLRDAPASALTLQALSGWLSLSGEPDREPVQTGGRLAEFAPGLPAAFATLAALLDGRRAHEPRPHRLDISELEVMATWHPPFELGSSYIGGRRVQRTGSRHPTTHPFTLLPCDGGRDYVGVITLTYQQWELLCRMMAIDDLLDDPTLRENLSRVTHYARINARMAPWLDARTAAECFETAQSWRIPFAMVPDVAAIRALPQHEARGFFSERTPAGAQPLDAAGAAWRGDSPRTRDTAAGRNSAAQLPDRARLPLQGVRVLDLSAFWAGPACARLFADLGAEVIKVESVQRIDGWRGANFGSTGSAQIYEGAAAHNGINVNKRGITLNLRSPEGVRLCKQLAAVSDVLVENYSPRVMAQFGLDWSVLREVNPHLVMVSLSGFGASGPLRDYVSYAATVECMAGVSALTGYKDGPPLLQGSSIGDPLGGVNGAVAAIAALYGRERSGDGAWIDLSQVEGVTALFGDQLLDYTLNGRVPPRRGNDSLDMCPHGVYRCMGDDQWLVIAAQDDAAWRSLCATIGLADLAADPALTTLAGRQAHATAIDAAIGAWTGEREKRAAMETLLSAGVAAGAVNDNTETVHEPQLLVRNFWQELDRAFVGRHPHASMGISVDGALPPLLRPAPTLGQHSVEVLRDVLGLCANEIDTLTSAHVTGETPVVEG
jgi:crotonobetainyl-CoA:carnitine CoA-transferase CaiB-like acyl-CoA transferase